jgi:hypothetical protein
VLAVDDSVHSAHALDWALSTRLAGPGDTLHCVSVALPVPYPLFDEASAAVAVLEAQQWQSSSERNAAYARELAARAAARAAPATGRGGASDEDGGEAPGAGPRVVSDALNPEGGASDVGAALVKYAERVQVRRAPRARGGGGAGARARARDPPWRPPAGGGQPWRLDLSLSGWRWH